jgi:hypothetical protein
MRFLSRLFQFVICVCFIHPTAFAQSTGSDIYETAWEIGNAITNYDVIYVDWSGYTPPLQFGNVTCAEIEDRGRIVIDKASETCVFAMVQVVTDDKSNRKGGVPEVLHYQDKKLTKLKPGMATPVIKNYESFDDFLFENRIPLVELPLHYYFPTRLTNGSHEAHLESFRKAYSAAKVNLLPDGKQLLKIDYERRSAEMTFDPTKFVFTQIKGIELGEKFPNGARIHCLVKPKYESVGDLFRLAEVEYEGFNGSPNPADKIGMVRFEWKGFNEEVVRIPPAEELFRDSSSIRRFLEGKEL